jgi:hypothetical protein
VRRCAPRRGSWFPEPSLLRRSAVAAPFLYAGEQLGYAGVLPGDCPKIRGCSRLFGNGGGALSMSDRGEEPSVVYVMLTPRGSEQDSKRRAGCRNEGRLTDGGCKVCPGIGSRRDGFDPCRSLQEEHHAGLVGPRGRCGVLGGGVAAVMS